jgi:hypothetical protein
VLKIKRILNILWLIIASILFYKFRVEISIFIYSEDITINHPHEILPIPLIFLLMLLIPMPIIIYRTIQFITHSTIKKFNKDTTK